MRIGKCPDCGHELYRFTQFFTIYRKWCPICKEYKDEYPQDYGHNQCEIEESDI